MDYENRSIYYVYGPKSAGVSPFHCRKGREAHFENFVFFFFNGKD
jgi:hypothetical protein